MKRQRVKFPWDLHWENTTYKLKRPISFVLYKKLRLSKKQRKFWTKLVKYFQIKLRNIWILLATGTHILLYFVMYRKTYMNNDWDNIVNKMIIKNISKYYSVVNYCYK